MRSNGENDDRLSRARERDENNERSLGDFDTRHFAPQDVFVQLNIHEKEVSELERWLSKSAKIDLYFYYYSLSLLLLRERMFVLGADGYALS